MNYLLMDRASEAAANDLAEVRKLIEGMNALVNSQHQLQLQQLQLQQQLLEFPPTTELPEPDAAVLMATLAVVAQQNNLLVQQHNLLPQQSIPTPPLTNTDRVTTDTSLLVDQTSLSPVTTTHTTNDDTAVEVTASEISTTENTPKVVDQDTQAQEQQQQTDSQSYSHPSPKNGVIIEVTHLSYNRTLYFQLKEEATIEPMISWLRLSFGDSGISGMVLQYKGFDGLWKCLLNRDDSLRRILKQSIAKGNTTVLQMRVPREQDLLSSGYTDRRLLALTKSDNGSL